MRSRMKSKCIHNNKQGCDAMRSPAWVHYLKGKDKFVFDKSLLSWSRIFIYLTIFFSRG